MFLNEIKAAGNNWYLHPIFHKFWVFDALAKQWMRDNRNLFLPLPEIEYDSFPPIKIVRKRRRRRRRKRTSHNRRNVDGPCIKPRLGVMEDDSPESPWNYEEDVKFEINETWIKYSKIHHDHKLERDKGKQELSKKYKKKKNRTRMEFPLPDYVDIQDINHLDINFAPSTKTPETRPFELRHAQLEELYGIHGQEIAYNETALQNEFECQCQKYNPSIWPIIPFSL